MEAAAARLQQNRDHARQGQCLIVANAVLQECELIKMATLAAALTEALH